MTRREAARGWRLPRPPVTGNGGHYWSMQPAEPVGSSAAADPAPTRVRAPSPCVRSRARVCAVRPPSTARAPPSWRRRPQVPARTRRGRRWQRACRPCRRRRAQERPCSRLSRRCDRAEETPWVLGGRSASAGARGEAFVRMPCAQLSDTSPVDHAAWPPACGLRQVPPADRTLLTNESTLPSTPTCARRPAGGPLWPAQRRWALLAASCSP